MKRLISIITLILLALGINAYAAAPDITVGSSTGFSKQSIAIPLTADFSVPVGSMSGTLVYDPNLLTPVSVVAGSANTGWAVVDNPNTPGKIIIGMFATSGKPISGTAQQIAVVNFTVNATPGTPTIAAPNLDLSNVVFDQNSITSVTNGNFTLSLLGDVDGDGKVTIADAQLVASSVVGLSQLTSTQTQNAQVDHTNAVDIYDAFLIAEYVAGVITTF